MNHQQHMNEQHAAALPAQAGRFRRLSKTAYDPLIILALAGGLTLASITIEGVENDIYSLPNWLQELQPVARPAAAIAMLLALFRFVVGANLLNVSYFKGPAAIAWSLNLLLLIKIYVLGNDLTFFGQAAPLVVMQILLFMLCLSYEQARFIKHNPNASQLTNFEESVFLFAILFASINLFLLVTAPGAVSTYFGRYMGTTANPQHTMMICVMCTPILAMVFRRKESTSLRRALALLVTVAFGIIVYQTGSRSGFVIGLMVLIACFADKFAGRRVALTVVGGLMFAGLMTVVFGVDIWTRIYAAIEGQYVIGREDTRTYVWLREFNEFLDNWRFGVPLASDGRLYFAESYWLAMMSNGGIIGFVMSMAILVMVLIAGIRLGLRGLNEHNPLRYRIYAASCLAVLLLSTVETTMAGIIATHTMLATAFLATAWQTMPERRQHDRVRKTARVKRFNSRRMRRLPQHSGA